MALVDSMAEIKRSVEENNKTGRVHDVIVVVLAEDQFGNDISEVGSASGATKETMRDIFVALSTQMEQTK